MKLFLVLLSALAIHHPAHAGEWTVHLFAGSTQPVPQGITLKPLASLTSDKNSNISYLNLMVAANGQVTGMYSRPDPRNRDTNEVQAKNIYPLAEIESSRGALLLKAQGKDVLFMQGKLNRSNLEGGFQIRYLKNGLFNQYESCELELRRSGANWYVRNAYNGKRVTNIKIITHSLGIETLQGICPN